MITLYPAIDLQDGRAVRLVQGDFNSATIFNEDPVAQARTFAEQGATALHVVDLDGAQAGRPAHAPVIAAIAAAFPGEVHLGGGLRSRPTIETALATGVHRVVLGTAALQDGDLLKWAIGRLADRVIVALDARDGMVATHGWTKVSDRSAVDVAAELVRTGVRHLMYTDIARDGTLEGPNYRALRVLAEAAPPLNIIMSGGVGSAEDLRTLRDLGLANLKGVIVGRAFYEGRLTVPRALEILGTEGAAG